MVLRDQQALIQANVSAATNMRTALNETVADTLKGRGSFDKILVHRQQLRQHHVGRIVESLFGNSLRAFEDEATRNFRAATEPAATRSCVWRCGRCIGHGSGWQQRPVSGRSCQRRSVAQLFDSVGQKGVQ
jgi:hypothetical protein